MEDSQKANLESMLGFISGKGGMIRFDRYMEEHLYGKKGYYQKKAKIGSGDFGTEAFRPEFAHLVFLNLQQEGLAGKDFVELGGGTGIFKRNYLAYSPETNYISVDISEKLASMQAQWGGRIIIGDAATLDLESDSIDGVIFSNELIDVLPCRVFKLVKENGRTMINEEGYAQTDGKALYFEFQDAERDSFLETYEEFLNRGIYPVEGGDIISATPKAVDVIKESLRVLRSGRIMFIDYGFGNALHCGREPEELPRIRRSLNYDESGDIAKILASPHCTDITYSVDFEFLKWVARQIDPDTKVAYRHLVSLMKAFPKDQNPLASKLYDHYDLSPFLVLSIDKPQ